MTVALKLYAITTAVYLNGAKAAEKSGSLQVVMHSGVTTIALIEH